MLLCEHSYIKQFHELFRAKDTNLGQIFSVLLANHTTSYGMYTEIDILTGQLKRD